MTAEVIEVANSAEFHEILKGNSRVFVDFFATWCRPCVMIAPEVDKLAVANAGIKFVKVDVDKMQDITRQFGVSAMPTFMAFKDGKSFGTPIMGANKPAIVKMVADLAN